MLRAALVLIAVSAAACAKGGEAIPPVDASRTDAPRVIDAQVIGDALVDARFVDAPVMIDAPIDAPSGPFCASNTECTVSGQCCLSVQGVGVCVDGIAVGANVCIPEL